VNVSNIIVNMRVIMQKLKFFVLQNVSQVKFL